MPAKGGSISDDEVSSEHERIESSRRRAERAARREAQREQDLRQRRPAPAAAPPPVPEQQLQGVPPQVQQSVLEILKRAGHVYVDLSTKAVMKVFDQLDATARSAFAAAVHKLWTERGYGGRFNLVAGVYAGLMAAWDDRALNAMRFYFPSVFGQLDSRWANNQLVMSFLENLRRYGHHIPYIGQLMAPAVDTMFSMSAAMGMFNSLLSFIGRNALNIASFMAAHPYIAGHATANIAHALIQRYRNNPQDMNALPRLMGQLLSSVATRIQRGFEKIKGDGVGGQGDDDDEPAGQRPRLLLRLRRAPVEIDDELEDDLDEDIESSGSDFVPDAKALRRAEKQQKKDLVRYGKRIRRDYRRHEDLRQDDARARAEAKRLRERAERAEDAALREEQHRMRQLKRGRVAAEKPLDEVAARSARREEKAERRAARAARDDGDVSLPAHLRGFVGDEAEVHRTTEEKQQLGMLRVYEEEVLSQLPRTQYVRFPRRTLMAAAEITGRVDGAVLVPLAAAMPPPRTQGGRPRWPDRGRTFEGVKVRGQKSRGYWEIQGIDPVSGDPKWFPFENSASPHNTEIRLSMGSGARGGNGDDDESSSDDDAFIAESESKLQDFQDTDRQREEDDLQYARERWHMDIVVPGVLREHARTDPFPVIDFEESFIAAGLGARNLQQGRQRLLETFKRLEKWLNHARDKFPRNSAERAHADVTVRNMMYQDYEQASRLLPQAFQRLATALQQNPRAVHQHFPRHNPRHHPWPDDRHMRDLREFRRQDHRPFARPETSIRSQRPYKTLPPYRKRPRGGRAERVDLVPVGRSPRRVPEWEVIPQRRQVNLQEPDAADRDRLRREEHNQMIRDEIRHQNELFWEQERLEEERRRERARQRAAHERAWRRHVNRPAEQQLAQWDQEAAERQAQLRLRARPFADWRAELAAETRGRVRRRPRDDAGRPAQRRRVQEDFFDNLGDIIDGAGAGAGVGPAVRFMRANMPTISGNEFIKAAA